LQIEQIAKAIGYDNRSSFSRAFRAIYKMDPSEYRTAALKRDEDIPTVDVERHDVK
jgi:AraC-like DNA-binding protein